MREIDIRADFFGFAWWRSDSDAAATFKRGTSGVGYLRKMLKVMLIPHLWKLHTDL